MEGRLIKHACQGRYGNLSAFAVVSRSLLDKQPGEMNLSSGFKNLDDDLSHCYIALA